VNQETVNSPLVICSVLGQGTTRTPGWIIVQTYNNSTYDELWEWEKGEKSIERSLIITSIVSDY
jgi:hypothetical protein